MIRKILFLFFVQFLMMFKAQDFYTEMRKKYWEYQENDESAFVYLNLCIDKARKEKNYAELYNAYKDAVRYSRDFKLAYADSAIVAAKLSNKNDLIGNAYTGKGIVYYFNYRKFQPALDEYVLANKYLTNAEDPFLKYQNLYHIGVVKSYLGYYAEALTIFEECIGYFEPLAKSKIHPNLLFNNQKGYLNSLHQEIVCYQALGNYKKSKELIDKGFTILPNDVEFNAEKSYFEKSKGVQFFHQQEYQDAIREFDNSISGLIKKNDFTWLSAVYYYRGKSYTYSGKDEFALADYKKVDSIFNKYNFILPQIRGNYEELINYSRKINNSKLELYYTKQLLKADSIISTDFKYLSPKIYREYETKQLQLSKEKLESDNSVGRYLLFASLVVIITLLGFVYYWKNRKRELQKRYSELLLSMESFKMNVPLNDETPISRSSNLDHKIVKKILSDLDHFEKSNLYIEKGITLSQLAKTFETNTSYLSQVINEYKSNNFNTYLNTLRVNFATKKMYKDRQWQKYSIEDIALASGFSSRQSFSKLFFEKNGIRPTDFLKKRKEELELQKVC